MAESNELQILNEAKYFKGTCEKRVESLPDKHNGQWTALLIFAGYCSTLGTAVPAGYCIGVMNSPGEFMRAWSNRTLELRYNVQLSKTNLDLLWSAVISIFLVGGAVGSFAGAIVANKYGRKRCVLICGCLFCIGAVCFFCCRVLNSIEMLILGRFVVGLAAGLTTSSLPMYLSEVAPLELRGSLGVFCAVGLTAGVVVGQVFSLRTVFGNESQWHIALSLYVVLVVVCFAPCFLYPESPKWLYAVKGDREEAHAQLMRLRGGNLKEDDFANEICSAEDEEDACGYCDVLKDKRLLLPLVIVCVYQGGQQLSGINAIFYYSVSIFRRAGVSDQAAEWANLGAGSLNLATSLLGPFLMARVNRRPLMLISSLLCSIFLLSFALMLNFIDDVAWFGPGCIACIFLYIFSFQFGVGPIPFFIGSELFQVSPRPVAMSLGSLSSWCCNFAVGMAFPTLQNLWGPFSFLPFSITCFTIFLLTKFYLPETRGRNPIDVAHLVSQGFRSNV
ncbi:solute carrier family 2, facilitated glucose transporter member 3-like [Musca vetustissima]|uniref:solute carrier family 2, facilitated glucose transporter member 3-like n=1 Tax=Musca vetustissima TaxID=27455 RepID=UPI002AB798E9|nr:solute carrier family 2, facilitated glucose transporter member 3-like [Musca vetustissima]